MLSISQLSKSFGDLKAVDDLSFEVGKGEIFGFLGPNGAGKTTTVHMIAGQLNPDAGEIRLLDLGRPGEPQVRRHLGVATQALSLYEELTGYENLAFFGRIQDLSASDLEQRVASALELVELTDRRDDRVSEYSGGMQRRLNLAVALVHNPQLLVLDEPTVGVDPQSRNAILTTIRRLADEGHAVVYTSHYMEEVEKICDRVGIMDHGKMLATGTVRELISQHGGKATLTVMVDGKQLEIETERPLQELERLGAQGEVADFALHNPDLERVFLNLTGRELRD